MKRNYIIASLVLLTAFATSCQKAEFEDAYEQAEDKTKAARVINDGVTGESGTAADEPLFGEPVDGVESIDEEIGSNPDGIINISIKEVSDGDDESDGGDDSRKKVK